MVSAERALYIALSLNDTSIVRFMLEYDPTLISPLFEKFSFLIPRYNLSYAEKSIQLFKDLGVNFKEHNFLAHVMLSSRDRSDKEIDILEKLILQNPGSDNEDNEKSSILIDLAQRFSFKKYKRVISLLLKYGADPFLENKSGNNTFSVVSQNSQWSKGDKRSFRQMIIENSDICRKIEGQPGFNKQNLRKKCKKKRRNKDR